MEFEPTDELAPEQRLMLALVGSAVLDMLYFDPTTHNWREARKWLFGAKADVTFRDCCDHLGLDPDDFRERLMSLEGHPLVVTAKKMHGDKGNAYSANALYALFLSLRPIKVSSGSWPRRASWTAEGAPRRKLRGNAPSRVRSRTAAVVPG